MRKEEYEERMKPMLWSMFAAASKSAGATSQRAATHADELVGEYETRFPTEAKREDD